MAAWRAPHAPLRGLRAKTAAERPSMLTARTLPSAESVASCASPLVALHVGPPVGAVSGEGRERREHCKAV